MLTIPLPRAFMFSVTLTGNIMSCLTRLLTSEGAQLRFVMLTRKYLWLMEGLLYSGPLLYGTYVFSGRMVQARERNDLT